MAQQEKPKDQPQDRPKDNPPHQGAAGGADQRSENLLPGTGGTGDGRFEVAEEVSLDQHSDEARRVGQAPGDGSAEALAEALKPAPPSQDAPPKP